MFFDFVCQISTILFVDISHDYLHLHMYVIFVQFVFELTFYWEKEEMFILQTHLHFCKGEITFSVEETY